MALPLPLALQILPRLARDVFMTLFHRRDIFLITCDPVTSLIRVTRRENFVPAAAVVC